MSRTKKLVWGGVFGALIAITTAYVKIPIATGYIHPGDGLIFASVSALGYAAALPAAIGSALADLLAGFPVYIPVSFVIKGLMALTAAAVIRRLRERLAFLGFITGALLMIGGYFLFECVIYSFEAALAAVPWNLLQAVMGIVIGALLSPVVKRASLRV